MKYDTGISLAQWVPFFGEWAANSQYGYVLSWHSSEAAAEQAAIEYYRKHPECDAHWGAV